MSQITPNIFTPLRKLLWSSLIDLITIIENLNNIMCITESINIDSHQANLKAFIQHCGTTQNGHYTSVIKKCSTWYPSNDNQIKETNLNQQINDTYNYVLFYKF